VRLIEKKNICLFLTLFSQGTLPWPWSREKKKKGEKNRTLPFRKSWHPASAGIKGGGKKKEEASCVSSLLKGTDLRLCSTKEEEKEERKGGFEFHIAHRGLREGKKKRKKGGLQSESRLHREGEKRGHAGAC